MGELAITVTGRAETELPPERATAAVSVHLEGADPLVPIRDATELAARVANGLRELHEAADGPVRSWSSDQLRTWSARPWSADGAELPIEHHASIAVRGEFSDFEALTGWLGWIAVLPGVSVDAIDWALEDETRDRVLAELRTLAVEDAFAKARSYALAVGRSDVVPQSISEPGLDDGPILPMSAVARGYGGGAQLEFTPAPITIAETVVVRFAAS